MDLSNKTMLFYPSQTRGGPDTAVEDIIRSQNIISRVMHSYLGILVPLGLLAGIFTLVVLIKNKVKHQTIENLDFFLLCLAVTDITIILYSFTSTTRPGYLEISNLSCGVLSLFFNISYYFSQYLLLVMFLMLLIIDESSYSSFITNRVGCMFLILIFSIVLSLVTSSLLGTYDMLQNVTYCQLDPLNANPEYDIVKTSTGFCIPSFIISIFCLLLIIHLRRTDVKEKLQAHWIILLNVAVMFACRLFYNIMLLRRTRLKTGGFNLSPGEELVMNIAELVVFSGSCVRLILIMTLHKPCWDEVKTAFHFLKKKCGGTETSNSVI
ncbi:uncharacterized protein PAF06_013521 [Gastrophryne carolinensis]